MQIGIFISVNRESSIREVENISHEVSLIVKFNCDFGSTGSTYIL